MALDEAFKTFTAELNSLFTLCFAVNPLYLIYPPYIPIPQRPCSQCMMSYLHQPSVISVGQLNHPHPVSKQLTRHTFATCSLYTSNKHTHTSAMGKWVKGSIEWQHKEVLFTSDRPSFDCLIGLECVLALDSLSVSQNIITHYLDNQPLCEYVLYGWSLWLVDCQICV